jgi:hypothetical protein
MVKFRHNGGPMTTSRNIAPAALALGLLLAACTPKTPEQKAQDAARMATEAAEAASAMPADAVSGLLSPAELAQAQEGTLLGYREDAARLSIHYFVNDRVDAAERRRWLSLAAATGSSQAIKDDVYFLANSGAPGDCAEARALIAKAKALYAREIAAATAKDRRDAKIEALETVREQERQMADGACGTAGR